MPKTVICKNVLGEECEMPVEKLFFRPSVYGILIKDNKILLSRQWDGYDFPGGGIEIGETIPEALEREFKEETGLQVKIGDFVDFVENFYKYRNTGQCCHSFLFYYRCQNIGGEITDKYLTDDEKEYCSKAEWIDLKDIEKIKFYNTVNSLGLIKKASLAS